MKVTYTIAEIDGKRTDKIRFAGAEICCEGMKTAWRRQAVAFSHDPDFRYSSTPKQRIVKVCIYRGEDGYDGIDYASFDISHCPFCGVKIVVVEVGVTQYVSKERTHTTVDVSEVKP